MKTPAKTQDPRLFFRRGSCFSEFFEKKPKTIPLPLAFFFRLSYPES